MDDREALAKSRARRGQVIACNYVLDDVLGVGGMGIVHVALQRSLQRTVAVKIPRPDLANDALVHFLFQREALTSSRINHRNIVSIVDFGEDAGVPYLVMEHIVGPRLGQMLHESGTLPVATATDIIRQLVGGLEDAHAQGVVHADVKCDNVLLQTQRDGTLVPRLIDFGIARFVDERMPGPPDRDTFVTGTPEYLAPEVARGQRATPAADIYALGVMFYELLTGLAPFTGGPAKTIMSRKLASEAIPVSVRSPQIAISPGLDKLISRMLARNPTERPADARELGRCLDSICKIQAAAAGALRTPLPPVEVFSTEAQTVNMTAHQATRTVRVTQSSLTVHRIGVIEALKSGDVDRIATAYLTLARALLDRREHAAAQAELEEGVEVLMTPGGSGPAWRLLLSLAALYEHDGERARARIAARAARDQAAETGSSEGLARSERLCTRLR